MSHFESAPEALIVIMDVMYRSSPAVQTHLTNLFSFAIKWPRATEFIRKALSNGLLSLMSYMLKSEALATQESAIGAITALVQKVSVVADLADLTTQVIDTILVSNMVETITRITTSPEFRIDSKAMLHVATLFELLSIHTSAHVLLYTPIDQGKNAAITTTGKGATGPVSAYHQALKLLNFLSEKGENMDIYAKTISSILSFCYYIISVAPRKETFIENTSLLKSCCRVLCKSRLPALKQETVNIFYLYAARTTAIASILLQARSYGPYVEALMNFTAEDAGAPSPLGGEKRGNAAESDEEDAEVSMHVCFSGFDVFCEQMYCNGVPFVRKGEPHL
jgi:hypothetical protein